MTVPQCEVAGHEGTERDAAPNRRKELEERRPRLPPEGTPIGRSLCSGGSPARPASPSLGSGPAQTGGRRKSRSAPIRTGPHQAALPSSPRSTAPERSPSPPRRWPSVCRQDGDSVFSGFSVLIYCLAGTSGAERTRPSALRHFLADEGGVRAATCPWCACARLAGQAGSPAVRPACSPGNRFLALPSRPA